MMCLKQLFNGDSKKYLFNFYIRNINTEVVDVICNI